MRLYSAHPVFKQFISLLVPGLFLFALAACSESKPEKDQVSISLHQERAESYLKGGRFRAAVIEARNILQKAPELPLGYEIMAQINRELGVDQQTIDLLAGKPDGVVATPKLLVEQANAFVNVGKAKSAKSIVQLLKLEEQKVSATELGMLEARIAILEGATPVADSAYQKLLAQDSDNLELLFDATKFYIHTKNFDTASELLARARIIEKNSSMRLFLLGLLEIQQNKLTAAELHLTEALDLRSSEDSMTANKAAILLQLEKLMQSTGRSVEAMAYREQLAEYYGPDNEGLKDKIERARELYSRQEYVASREILEDVVEQFPRYSAANLMLATLDFRSNDMDSAALRFIEHIDLESHDSQLIEMAVLSSLASEKSAQLLALFDQSMAVDLTPHLLNAQARLLSANGETEKAIASAQKAIELDPVTISHYVLLANIHRSTAETAGEANKKALDTLSQALKENSNQGNSVDDASLLGLSKLYVSALLFDGGSHPDNTSEAKSYIEQQLKISDGSPAAHELAASFYVLKQDFSMARDHANQSLDKDPGSKTMLLGLAAITRELDRPYAEVLDVYRRVVELEPQQPEAYFKMLGSARNEGEFDQAAERVEKLAKLHRSSTAFAVLSRAYLERQNSDKAESYYQQAKELADSTSGSQEFERAIIQARAAELIARSEFAEAKKALEDGLEEYGETPAMLAQLIELEMTVGKYANSRVLLSRLEKIEPAMASLYDAELDMAQGNTDSAIVKYQELWGETKTDLLAQRLYLALREKGQKKADQIVSEWGREIPNSISQKQIASSMAIQSGDYESAIQSIEFLLQRNPRDVRSLNNLAWLYQKKGDKRAIDLAERAYRLAPEQADVIDTYAWILAENGHVEKAIPLFEKALDLDPDNREILKNLENARAKL